MGAASLNPEDRRTLEAAAHWYALLSSDAVTASDKARWRQWLDGDSAHRRAWSRVEAISAQFDAAMPDPAARLAGAAGLDAAARGRRDRRRLLSLALAGGAAGLLGLGLARTEPGQRWLAARGADFVTPVGAQRDTTLADGTRIWLNTDTAMRVDYRADVRRIVLLRGEIMIVTASDASRPFLVETDEGTLRALGTRFNVQSADGVTELAVFEGAVQARFRSDGTEGVRVDAGMRIRGGRGMTPLPGPLGAQDGNWMRGILQVEDAPLSQVVAELARYRRGYLACDEAVAGLRVTGTFPLRDTDRALSMLAHALPVRISRPLSWWTTLQPN